MRNYLFAAVLMGLTSCAQVNSTPLSDQPIDDSFLISGGGSRPVIVVAAKAYENQGMVAFCGAWTHSKFTDPYAGTFLDQFMSSSKWKFDGVTIVGSVKRLNKARFNKETGISGGANCIRTDMVWKSNYADLKPQFVAGATQQVIWD